MTNLSIMLCRISMQSIISIVPVNIISTACKHSLSVILCAIWYHSDNLKSVEINYGGVLLSVKLQALACNFTKTNNVPWVFFAFFKLHK